ncbi:jg8769 [Pararge aegeria aegeria]|uniref:ribonuclease H n=1 Tax=Pararge aegeria aegeria TaxID=348720 RepID=A0A8S4S2A7_9NEOP|nr:jg8769 [Pararge aegeria aegeria]
MSTTGHISTPYVAKLDRNYKVTVEGNITYKTNTAAIDVYTDGSKTNSGTGSGVYCPELNKIIAEALGRNNSVFQAECVGITTAATAMLNRKVSGFDININSYSQAVLKALTKYTTLSKILQDCHNALQTLTQSNRITLRWIRGHNGNTGNDAADELARLATSLKVVGPEPIIPISFSEYKAWLHKQTQSSHSELWINGNECKHTKEVFPNLNTRLTTKVLKLSRKNLRTVVSMITGHCSLNKHLFILGITDSTLCRACMETPTHVLLQCRGVVEQRAAYLGSQHHSLKHLATWAAC